MAETLWSTLEKNLLHDGKAFISVTGGGGKTSFLVYFSEYLKKRGYSVLVTTSTKVASPFSFDYKVDRVYLDSSVKNYWPKKGESVFFGFFDREKGKIVAPGASLVSLLYERYDVVIVEADGSRRLPMKLHSQRDPVIWAPTTAVVAIMGMWGYGKKVEDVVFGDKGKGKVDKNYLEFLLENTEGLGKGMVEGENNVFLFNGSDEVEDETKAAFLSLKLSYPGYLVSIKEGRIYESV